MQNLKRDVIFWNDPQNLFRQTTFPDYWNRFELDQSSCQKVSSSFNWKIPTNWLAVFDQLRPSQKPNWIQPELLLIFNSHESLGRNYFWQLIWLLSKISLKLTFVETPRLHLSVGCCSCRVSIKTTVLWNIAMEQGFVHPKNSFGCNHSSSMNFGSQMVPVFPPLNHFFSTWWFRECKTSYR